MPDEALWSTFFQPEAMLRKLGLTPACRDAVDFGCGYGTFAIPAARIVRGTVYALDIEPAMVEATQAKASAAGLTNLRVSGRDFVASGTGLPAASVHYAMLFNILHCEQPVGLLREAARILAPGGLLAVMHWNPNPRTPRGPSLAIRPRPEQCRAWACTAGFAPLGPDVIDLPPYHYGLLFRQPTVADRSIPHGDHR